MSQKTFVFGMMKTLDPFNDTQHWNEICDQKVFKSVHLSADGEVNSKPAAGAYLKVVCVSDTHEQLDKVQNIPDGDVLIHAGDFTNTGSREHLELFNQHLAALPHKHKIVVAGNHELGFDPMEDEMQRDEKYKGLGTPNGQSIITAATVLHDNSVTIDGVKFYGASWHALPGYPFYRTRFEQLPQCWTHVPHDTDVLITHSPPLGCLDEFDYGTMKERWGCRALLATVEAIKPKFHVFGHLHDCYGSARNENTIFINAAACERKNKIANRPIVFYIQKKQ